MNIALGEFRFYFIVAIVNILGLIMGMMLTWPSPVIPKLVSIELLDENPLGRIITASEQSWIAALPLLGGAIGPSLAGFLMEALGKKLTITLIHIPNLLACLCAAFGNNIWYLFVARFVTGISVNAGIGVSGLYLGEIGKHHVRGVINATTSICLNLGTLLSYCIGPYTSIMVFNLILAGVSATGSILAFLFVPESPYYLVQNRRMQEAHNTLKILRNTNDVEEEIKIIQDDISHIKNDGVLAIFKSRASRKPFFIAVLLTCMQQFSGISVIYSYTQLIFDQAGSTLSSDVSSILVGVAQFVTIFLTVFGVERFGRKKLLAISSSGLAFTLAIFGTYFYFQSSINIETSKIKWLPLVCLVLFFVFFNSGMAGLPFLYMSETLPHNVKSASASLILGFYSTVGFIVTYFYNNLVDVIGNSSCFYFFAVAMAACAIYVTVYLYETQGKTLQEISAHFEQSKYGKKISLR